MVITMETFTIDDDILTKAMITWGIRLQAMKTIEEVTEYAIEAKIFDEKLSYCVSNNDDIKDLASEEADILIMTSQISKYFDSLTSGSFSRVVTNKLEEMSGVFEFGTQDMAIQYINCLTHALDGKQTFAQLAIKQAALLYLVESRRNRANERMCGLNNDKDIYTNLVKNNIEYKISRVRDKLDRYSK